MEEEKLNGKPLRHFRVYDEEDTVKLYEIDGTVVTAMTSSNPEGEITVYHTALTSTDFERIREDEIRGRRPQRGFSPAVHRAALSVPIPSSQWGGAPAATCTTVGYLQTSWNYSRGITPPPYVTMDNRRRPVESAYIDYDKLVHHAIPVEVPPIPATVPLQSQPSPTTGQVPDITESLENMSIELSPQSSPTPCPAPSQNITSPLPNPWRVTSEARIRRKAREGQWDDATNIDREVVGQTLGTISYPDFFPILGARKREDRHTVNLPSSALQPQEVRSSVIQPLEHPRIKAGAAPAGFLPAPLPPSPPRATKRTDRVFVTVSEESERPVQPDASAAASTQPKGKRSGLLRAEKVLAHNRKRAAENRLRRGKQADPELTPKLEIKEEPESE